MDWFELCTYHKNSLSHWFHPIWRKNFRVFTELLKKLPKNIIFRSVILEHTHSLNKIVIHSSIFQRFRWLKCKYYYYSKYEENVDELSLSLECTVMRTVSILNSMYCSMATKGYTHLLQHSAWAKLKIQSNTIE